MFSFRYLILAAAMMAAAAAMPRSLTLTEMMNNTVCAIEVKYDVEINRIPQRIKLIKCAKNTSHWCQENNIKHEHCCHNTHNHHVMECVEMTDTVQVFYKDRNAPESHEVAVGCACMIGRSTVAPKVEGPW